MSSIVNGDHHPMVATGNLSNGVLGPTKTSHHHSNGTTTTERSFNAKSFQKPQISIESADILDETSEIGTKTASTGVDSNHLETHAPHYGSHSTPNSPLARVQAKTDKNPTNLKVVYGSSPRSNSLPHGLAMVHDRSVPSASGYESDTSDDTQLSDERGGEEKQRTRQTLYSSPVRRKKHSDTLDSTSELYLDSSSDSSSEEDEGIQSLATENDDEVFHEAEMDMYNEADTKLVDWADNVFVPACSTLLDHCLVSKESGRSSNLIQSDLRNLSNTINYFCSEQQRLSGVLRAQMKGISQSISTDRFSKLRIDKSKTLQLGSSGSNASLSSEASSGFDGHDSRSYAVKVLRSVSQSLIAPLMSEAEHGFTHELYKSIVQALQKISWKVEACLSFNDPSRDFEIHTKIFDRDQTSKVRTMMIGAIPPEEPKLKSAVTHLSVSDNLLAESEEDKSPRPSPKGTPNIIRRTPSGRTRPSGTIFDSANLPSDLAQVTQTGEDSEDTTTNSSEMSPERISKIEEALSDAKSNYSPSRLRRTQTVAVSDSPKRVSQAITWERQSGSPRYFRPKANRRTTISLSRHEVTRLGLASNESMLLASLSHATCIQEKMDDEHRAQLKDRLTSEFGSFGGNQYKKSKSASTPDLLDDDNYDKKKSSDSLERRDSVPSASSTAVKQPPPPLLQPISRKPLASQTSSDSDVFSPNYQQSFVPLPSHVNVDNEWVHVPNPDSTMDPRTIRRGTYDPLTSRDSKKESKHKMTKSEKKAAKKASKSVDGGEKKISSSGRFTQSLIKTAQALRRGSTASRLSSKKSPFRRGRVGSLDLLSEAKDKQEMMEEEIVRPASAMSESVTSSSTSSVKSETMPTTKSHRGGTLSRLVSNKKSKQSRSFSKGDSLARRKKAQRSGFLNSYPADDGIPAADPIEYYSQNADQTLRVEGDEQLLIAVDVANKVPAKSQKRKSFISSSGGQWFEIVVTTNIKQFKRNHYTILRPFKQVTSLYDALASSHVGHVYQFPDRPDRKGLMKKQKQQMEELLRWIAGNPELRKSEPFVSFLMPDDEFGSWEPGSEVSFDLLMTFYTPNIYPGSADPGSNHGIHMVEEPPSKLSPSPTHGPPHKPSLQKRGTFYFVKGEKEDCSTFVIKEEGRDALIVACEEDDRYVVVAGTFEKLVEQLACEEKPDPRFVFTFLFGYRHFAPAMELLTMLLTRFHMTVPPDATEEEMAYAEKWRYVIQLRVLDILTYWMKKCWPDFYRDSSMLAKVKEFIESLKASKDTNFQLAGTDLEKVIQEKLASCSKQYAAPPSPLSLSPSSSSPATPTKSSKFSTMPPLSPVRHAEADPSPSHEFQTWKTTAASRRDCSVDVSMLTAIQLARQLTLIELEFLKAIGTHELVVYTWESNSPENKPYRRNIDAFIARFNKVSYWVASEICCVNDAKLRGALIEKFIEVAKHCKELKNFNTTISVVTGLSLAAVRRLKKSWEFVSEKTTKSFRKLMQITDPTNNHINYRKMLSSVHRRVGDQCIPYFGVYMRDLTFLNDATQKTLKNGLLNFSKLRTMVLKFEELKRYQKTKYFFPPEDKTQDFCRHLWCLSESDLYDASLSVEPREAPVITPSTETEV